jgi:hypothetical protein
VGRLYPNVEKDVPADYVAVALLAKFCNGKNNKEYSTLPSRQMLIKLL